MTTLTAALAQEVQVLRENQTHFYKNTKKLILLLMSIKIQGVSQLLKQSSSLSDLVFILFLFQIIARK